MQVYEGKITDDTKDIETYFYDQPSTSQRRNRHVYPTEGNGKGTDLRILDVGEVFERTGLGFGMGFVHPEGTQRVLLSMYVVVDLDTRDGLGFVGEALRYLVCFFFSLEVGILVMVLIQHCWRCGTLMIAGRGFHLYIILPLSL